MNLLLSDEQTQIVDSLKAFLRDRAPVSRFRPPAPQIGNADHALWPQLADLVAASTVVDTSKQNTRWLSVSVAPPLMTDPTYQAARANADAGTR